MQPHKRGGRGVGAEWWPDDGAQQAVSRRPLVGRDQTRLRPDRLGAPDAWERLRFRRTLATALLHEPGYVEFYTVRYVRQDRPLSGTMSEPSFGVSETRP